MSINENIFEHGADSLRATWIRNTIFRVLREAEFKTRQIPSDIVSYYLLVLFSEVISPDEEASSLVVIPTSQYSTDCSFPFWLQLH